jgi:methylated-DNA-[protein]-cysteine S-methyltransferase
MTIDICEFDSPLGAVRLALCDGTVCAMGFADHWRRLERTVQRRFGPAPRRSASAPTDVLRRLRAYFGGELGALEGIAADPGGTPFQRRVWTALRAVPPGRTTSYGALATAIGAPSAVRAVGAATGANPIWVVIPCHRAIGADGRLVGYAGGVERKRWLLAHEGALVG